jgi:hypothetical protein
VDENSFLEMNVFLFEIFDIGYIFVGVFAPRGFGRLKQGGGIEAYVGGQFCALKLAPLRVE